MQSIANVLSVFRIPSPTSSVILHLLLLLLPPLPFFSLLERQRVTTLSLLLEREREKERPSAL